MESNYEVGERVELNRPYINNVTIGTFIPSGEILLLVDGPHATSKYGATIFSWSVLLPCGKLIKIPEDYF
jgi:hypothetical protein